MIQLQTREDLVKEQVNVTCVFYFFFYDPWLSNTKQVNKEMTFWRLDLESQ